MVIYKELNWETLMKTLKDSVKDITVITIMGCSIQETVRYGWPFYVAVLLVVVFMVFFPDAVLWLPNLVYGA